MRPLSRRRVLALGGLGVASTVVGGTGLIRGWPSSRSPSPVTGLSLAEPEVLSSSAGNLQVRLEAAPGTFEVAGRQASVLGYNGGLPGPTLGVQPGDRLQVALVNGLQAPTNLHVHGLAVSPQGNGDNMFVTVDPGASFDYDYQLPADHPPGVYWYHPHHHGMVAEQVFGGLYGAIIVDDPDASAVPATRERVLVISDISLDSAGQIPPTSTMTKVMGRQGDLVLVNGQRSPVLAARPGERERWRIVNACAARYLRLTLGGQQLQLLGMDSGRFATPQEVTEVVLAPGNRADVLVGTAAGTAELRALPYNQGGMGMMGGSNSPANGTILATLDVTGPAAAALAPVAPQPQPRDLRGVAVDRRRELTFAIGMGGAPGSFTVDGKAFDPARVDQAVRVGTVEEWTLRNTSPMDHPIHLHVWPMQLVETNGQPAQEATRQDVVNVPAQGNVKVRVAFDTFGGRTVYHCHILDHEDLGMMGVVDVR